MSDVVYRSEVRIERVKGPVRRAYLPAEQEPVIFGVHGAVAEHYKVPPAVLEPHATALDYVVAARRVDSPEPSGARWRRVKLTPRMRGWCLKRSAKLSWTTTYS
jgi:hypothetical protein